MGGSRASSSRDGKGKEPAGGEEERPSGEENRPTNDNQLPRSGVVRMMRQVLAAHMKVSGPAKNLAQGCAAEFISAVVDEAAKRCNQQERHMLTPEDVAWSLRSLGLDRYVEPMGTYLRRYREAAARDGASYNGNANSNRVPAVGDLIDEELMQILAQIMNDTAGGDSSSMNNASGSNSQ